MTDYQNNVASKMSKMLEETISGALIKAVQNLSIEIDEEELLKMLRDSKKQYQSGYNDRDSEIVRCKDCYFGEHTINVAGERCVQCTNSDLGMMGECHTPNWFCADGERRDETT